MPSQSYLCKYCHQTKPTQTALNRHIAHSAVCLQAWQENLLNLTSGGSGSINSHFATINNSIPLDLLENDDFNGEVAITEEIRPASNNLQVSSLQRSEESGTGNDARSQIRRYRKGYPVGYAAKIFGEGKTKFQIWKEDQILHGENEWAPFENQKEWDLAWWLIKNVGQTSIDEFLRLPIVSL